MRYTYKGTKFNLTLTDDGKIVCHHEELGTVEGKAAEEVQAEIRRQFDIIHDPKKRIKILTFGERWNSDEETSYYEGQTTGIKADKWGYWITWKENGDKRRAKVGTNKFWLDTPENRERLNKIIEKRKIIETIEIEINALIDELEQIKET